MSGKLWRYISARFAFNVCLVLSVVCGIIFAVESVENLRRASNSDAGIGIVFALSALRLPWLAEQVMPFALLIATMMTFLSLGRSHELTVARSTGMSVWQFTGPVLLITLAFGLASTLVLNPLAANLLALHSTVIDENLRTEAGVEHHRWIRQGGAADGGSSVMYSRLSQNVGQELSGVTAFVYGPTGQFQRRIEAESATLTPGRWDLTNMWTYVPEEKPIFSETGYLPTNLSAEQIGQSLGNPQFVSFWALRQQIEIWERAGLNADAFRLQYQSLLARPLLYLAMAVIAASVSLRLFRFGNISNMILGGIGAGFLLYVGAKVTGDLGVAGVLNASVAAWAPPLVACFLGTTVLLFQEDG
ncbi:LPS export ABC transporter permease LptG [Tepidamorphus sp. 3E244]|uniref:LPS export ABC transporter permease LptG n=1 Tax=Tepidamorphus sp. 3E244 TaxID=3385498 RepID=UPI0038FCBBBA